MPGGVVNALARLLAGGLFLVSGLAKLWAPGPFPAAVVRLVPVPVASGFVIAWLPVAEVALGLLVLSGLWRRASALAVLLCSACFLAVRLASGIEACGCFGALEVGERVGLALDLLLLGSSVVLVADAGTPRVFRRKVRVPFGRDLEGNGEDVR